MALSIQKEVTEKMCPSCKETKPLSGFHKDSKRKLGVQAYCKICLTSKNEVYGKTEAGMKVRRKINLKHKYGVSEQDFNKILEHQGGGCAICFSSEDLVLDHDHATKVSRGILCRQCNAGLGNLRDDVFLLETAIWYLTRELPVILESEKKIYSHDRKKMWRDSHLRIKYSISLDQFEHLLHVQNGLCAICGNMPPEERNLAVDHNAKTGQVRGLLCVTCNVGLGNFKDSIFCLETAKTYLKLGV